MASSSSHHEVVDETEMIDVGELSGNFEGEDDAGHDEPTSSSSGAQVPTFNPISAKALKTVFEFLSYLSLSLILSLDILLMSCTRIDLSPWIHLRL